MMNTVHLYFCCQLTQLGHLVDECIQFTVSEQISKLRAAVECHVEDAKPALSRHTCVQHGCLDEGALSLVELVVMFHFHRNGFITVYTGQLHVRRVGHEEIT